MAMGGRLARIGGDGEAVEKRSRQHALSEDGPVMVECQATREDRRKGQEVGVELDGGEDERDGSRPGRALAASGEDHERSEQDDDPAQGRD
jgi:hypothetical protein